MDRLNPEQFILFVTNSKMIEAFVISRQHFKNFKNIYKL